MAAFYGVYHGPDGLRKIANRVHNMAVATGKERGERRLVKVGDYLKQICQSVSLSVCLSMSLSYSEYSILLCDITLVPCYFAHRCYSLPRPHLILPSSLYFPVSLCSISHSLLSCLAEALSKNGFKISASDKGGWVTCWSDQHNSRADSDTRCPFISTNLFLCFLPHLPLSFHPASIWLATRASSSTLFLLTFLTWREELRAYRKVRQRERNIYR